MDGFVKTVKDTKLIGNMAKEVEKTISKIPEVFNEEVKKGEEAKKLIRERVFPKEKLVITTPTVEVKEPKFFSAVTEIANGLENAVNTFVEKGKLGMKEIADIGSGMFKESFGNVVGALKGQFTGLMKGVFGTDSELMNGIMSGVVALASFALSRLKSASEATYHSITETAVESAAAMRGVVAGIESIGIQEVSQRLITGISPLLNETKSLHFTVRGIAEDLRFIRNNFSGKTDNLSAAF